MNPYQTPADELAELEDRLREDFSSQLTPVCTAAETSTHYVFLVRAKGYSRDEVGAQLLGNEILLSAWRYPQASHTFPQRHYEIFQTSFTLPLGMEGSTVDCKLGSRENEFLFLIRKPGAL